MASFNVTRFGEISPLWQHFMNLCEMVKGLLYLCQIVEPTLAKWLFWDSNSMLYMAQYGKIRKPSGSTG